jgi:hypothetical protein
MKKIYSLSIALFIAVSTFAQTSLTYKANVLRPGDVRNLKKIEYQDPGEAGPNKVWDFSQSKELGDMVISQAENRAITKNSNLFLVCNEGDTKNTHFEISKTKKMYWGLENSRVKIEFKEPIIDLKFPFSYQEKIGGIMDGTYTENNKSNPISGSYTTEADAWGTLILPDGNIYYNILRIKVEKFYTQIFQDINGNDQEYKIHTVRYQYFTKGVRYPLLIVLESEIKTDCGCACGYKSKEAYYETPSVLFGPEGNDILSEDGDVLLEKFEYLASPNPFENNLNISFSLKKNTKIEINLLDINGKIVEQIVNEKMESGDHAFNTNTSNIIAGQYVLQIKVNKQIYSTKLVKR